MDKIPVGLHHYIFTQFFGSGLLARHKTLELVHQTQYKYFEPIVPFLNVHGEVNPVNTGYEVFFWAQKLKPSRIKIVTCHSNIPFHAGLVSQETDRVKEIVEYTLMQFPHLKVWTVNAMPLDWGNPFEKKSEKQLKKQLEEIKLFSALLQERECSMALHFHQHELIEEGRELDFMMNNTTADQLGLTLDVNWCVQSDYPVAKVLAQYGDRLLSLHIRSSSGKKWQETLQNGDENIDEVLPLIWKTGFHGPHVVEIANSPGVQYEKPLLDRLNESHHQMEKWLEKYPVQVV